MLNKRILILIFVLAFLTLLVGCQTTPSVPVKLTEIKVSPDKITMAVGTTLQLQVTAFFDDGNHADITSKCIYSSSDSFIVIVNTYEGKVIAKGLGKAFIVVVDSYEGMIFTDTAEVTVSAGIIQEEPIKIIR